MDSQSTRPSPTTGRFNNKLMYHYNDLCAPWRCGAGGWGRSVLSPCRPAYAGRGCFGAARDWRGRSQGSSPDSRIKRWQRRCFSGDGDVRLQLPLPPSSFSGRVNIYTPRTSACTPDMPQQTFLWRKSLSTPSYRTSMMTTDSCVNKLCARMQHVQRATA